jgi:hypothetical protein
MTLVSDPNSVAVGSPVIFTLEAIVEPNSHGDFEIEVLAPYDSSARAKVCQVDVEFTGANIGCVIEPTVEFYSRDDGSVADRAVFPATRIDNYGYKSEADDPEANIVRFRIVAQVNVLLHVLSSSQRVQFFSV